MATTKIDNQLTDSFLSLVVSGLGGPAPASFRPLGEEDWQAILQLAKTQTVTGLIYSAVSSLPEDANVPEDILFTLINRVKSIKARSVRGVSVAKELCAFFTSKGLHPLVMKGPVVAAFYPQPLLRESGDIDLYFQGQEFDKATELMASEGTQIRTTPDGSISYRYGEIDIDQHRAYYDLHTPTSDLPRIGTRSAALMMLSAHILKHCMFSGIGLRQVCDIAKAYESLDGEYDKSKLRAYYEKAGLTKWNRLLCGFLHNRLGVDTAVLPYAENELLPDEELFDIIFSGGNFGHFSEGRGDALTSSPIRRKMDTARRFLKRIPFSFRYGRREFFPAFTELLRGNLSR